MFNLRRKTGCILMLFILTVTQLSLFPKILGNSRFLIIIIIVIINWYKHVPKLVETSQGGKVTILWNQQVQTDRTIHNNKPEIIIRDIENGNMCVNRRCNFRRQKCV